MVSKFEIVPFQLFVVFLAALHSAFFLAPSAFAEKYLGEK